MAALTAAQSQKLIAQFRDDGHSSRINKDGIQNVLTKMTVNAGNTGQTTLTQHECRTYVGFCPPTTTDYPDAKIGDKYLELSADSDEASNPFDYQEWKYGLSGWEREEGSAISETVLTAAQVKAATTAVSLVSAPGAGKTAIVTGPIELLLSSGTTAYDGVHTAGTEDIAFHYSDTNSQFEIARAEQLNFLSQTTNVLQIANPDANAVAKPNTAIQMYLTGSPFAAAGDLGLTVRVPYRVVKTAALA